MAESDHRYQKRQASKGAMAVGVGACVLIVVGIGWFVWSNLAADRSAKMAQEVSPEPVAVAPGARGNGAGRGAASPAAGANLPQGAVAQVSPAVSPDQGNGNGLSIEISSLVVTTRPDELGNSAGAGGQ